MKKVILESPYAGTSKFLPLRFIQRWLNVRYARKAMRDCLLKGEAPITSHLLYTQPGVLNDDKPDERKLGIDAGLSWRGSADYAVVYTDRGISKGMEYGIKAHKKSRKKVVYRKI